MKQQMQLCVAIFQQHDFWLVKISKKLMKFTSTLSYATVHLNIVRIYVSRFINWYIPIYLLQNSVKSDI